MKQEKIVKIGDVGTVENIWSVVKIRKEAQFRGYINALAIKGDCLVPL